MEMSHTLYHADCMDLLRELPPNSVDSIVTDPPYGLGFMGKAWDEMPPGKEWAELCLRVLKPGGHILAFGGSRTWHRLAVAIEDAGFEIRDSIAWMYGSGFPKSLDVSKAIQSGGGRPESIRRLARGDKYTPSGRGRVNYDNGGGSCMNGTSGPIELSPEAQQWTGWGTALKPAFEPVVVGRKPFPGTVAANVLSHGTGALNIEACRVGTESTARVNTAEIGYHGGNLAKRGYHGGNLAQKYSTGSNSGRWPANVILDESQGAELDAQSGISKSVSGGASRFFYCAKAPKSERPNVDGVAHETVKPLTLMRYLVKLVTPEGGTVLEPFAGSGATVEACLLEGFSVIAIEREARYIPLIEHRIARATAQLMEELI